MLWIWLRRIPSSHVIHTPLGAVRFRAPAHEARRRAVPPHQAMLLLKAGRPVGLCLPGLGLPTGAPPPSGNRFGGRFGGSDTTEPEEMGEEP